MWRGNQRPDFPGDAANGRGSPTLPPIPEVKLSKEALAAQAAEATQEEDALEPRLALLKTMIELMTGKRIHLLESHAVAASSPVSASQQGGLSAEAPARAGFGIEYDFHESYEEVEQTTVSASGMIKTADGREISFTLDLSMSRRYYEETNISIRAGDAVRKDPLVINFGGTAAQLQDQTFRFDLDGDGDKEELARFASASGYLALDKNDNGRIDSGLELFGPATNSGFGELTALDDDRNGWIDENDAAFANLKVWVPDDNGGKLTTLKEAGVGALALAHIKSQFELRGQGNSDLGAVRDTGVFLFENGRVGSLQEIDLTV